MAREIPLPEGLTAIVDDEDFEHLSQFKWGVSSGYATRTVKDEATGYWKPASMHRLLMNAPDGMVVDHVNGDPLDNRKANLRVCTPLENSRNIPTSRLRRGEEMGRWMNVSELAVRLGVPSPLLGEVIREGFVPAQLLGTHWVVPRHEATPEVCERLRQEVVRRLEARPPKPESHYVSVRLTQEEVATLKALARRWRTNESAAVRMLVRTAAIREGYDEDDEAE